MEVSDSVAHILPLGSQSRGCDFLPDVKSVLHFLPIDRRGEAMPTGAEMLGDGPVGREEPLGVAWGFDPWHAPLPLPGGLVRILRSIIEIAMLAMFHAWEELALSGSVALQLVGDDHARHVR